MVSKLLPHEYELIYQRHDELSSDELRAQLASKTINYPSVARQVLRDRGEPDR